MLLQKLAALAGRTASPLPIGLELRPDRFALIYMERTLSAPPLIQGYCRHPLMPGDADAAAALRDAWHRLALPGRQALLSVPCPPARFVQLPADDALLSGSAWRTDDEVGAEIKLPARPGLPPRTLAAAVPAALLDRMLALLEQAELEAVQVQIDVLALLTAFSHTPAWTSPDPIARTLVHASDNRFAWHTLDTADGLPCTSGLAQDSAELAGMLAAQPPDLLLMAGPVGAIRPLMASLQTRLPNTRFCTNPFAGCRLAHEEDRRPITAWAPELSVALGLALGACQ